MGPQHVRLSVQTRGTTEEVECILRCFEHHGASVDGWAIRGVGQTGVMSEFDVSSPGVRSLDCALHEVRDLRSVLVLWVADLGATGASH